MLNIGDASSSGGGTTTLAGGDGGVSVGGATSNFRSNGVRSVVQGCSGSLLALNALRGGGSPGNLERLCARGGGGGGGMCGGAFMRARDREYGNI